MPKLSAFVATWIAAAAAASSAVRAQEVCVSCSEPDITYKCSIKHSDRAAGIRGASQVIEYVCMTELARLGQHASCRVSREFSGPCIGQPREIDLAKVETPPVQSGPGPSDTAAGQPGAPAAPAQAPRAPRTLEEMAKGATESSKEQWSATNQSLKQAAKDAGDNLGKAGSAVGDAVKKSVTCVITLFIGCFEKEQPK